MANQRMQNMAMTRAIAVRGPVQTQSAPVSAPTVQAPVQAPVVKTDAVTEPLRMPQRSVKGNLKDRPGSMGRGAPTRAGKIPTISPAVADMMDQYSSVDEVLAYAAVMRKVVALKKQGYTTSSDLRVVRPPNYKDLAIKSGAIPPQPNISMTTDKPEDTPASLVYASQKNYVGTSGDPQAKFRQTVAFEASAEQPASEVSQMQMPVGQTSVGGVNATGYTPGPEGTAPGAVPGHLLQQSIGIAEGYNNNPGGGSAPEPVAIPAPTGGRGKRSTMFSRKI